VNGCESLKEPNDDCYRVLAKKVRDPNICNKIGEESLKESCMTSVAVNMEYCEKIDKGLLKDKCILMHTALLEDCYRIEDKQIKEECLKTNFGKLIKILNTEVDYSGTLIEEYTGQKAVCGECLGLGMRYEYANTEWLSQQKCCYVLNLSYYKIPAGELNKPIKLKAIVRKPECEALKFDLISDRHCSLGCECNRLFFEVKE